MKFGCRFSILLLFCVIILQFQTSLAAICPNYAGLQFINGNNFPLVVLDGEIECDVCAYIECDWGKEPKYGAGCPNDELFQTCQAKYSSDIEIIKSKSPERMYYQTEKFTYFSGCSNAGPTKEDGLRCVRALKKKNYKEYRAKKASGEKTDPYIRVDPAPTDTNNSNNQNGALKLIGIIAIGWIFVSAWIY
uniref:Uncharacterized protein n=1 Tax=Panagrolaimus sp. ES5 TaxID=591445 RepID=A0AC34F305_9BILA